MTDGRAAAHGQRAYGVRLEWGPTGAAAVAVGADIAVVVDVLSFTTTLSVAVEHGIRVFPYSWKDHRAQAYADERDAVLAVGRFEARSAAAAVSLSPTQMAHADGPERIVLPSPNGSAISFALATSGLTVVGACLRNRSAVGRWLAPQVAAGARLAVVAAGERWPDGSLRPGLEDLWGAGAVLEAMGDVGDLSSEEAAHAATSYAAAEPHLSDRLHACASGRELVSGGYADDVAMAAEIDVSDVVPMLDRDAFVAAPAG